MPRPSARDAYHHGDLRRTLLDAADQVLAERGLDGFALREVARRAGVSPAAPAHHFGDVAGLLDALATEAFRDLARALIDGERRFAVADDARGRLIGQGVGYVQFALRHPGRFRLMFERDGPPEDAALREAGSTAFAQLERGVRALFGLEADAPIDGLAGAALLAMWSIVHGFAQLALAGALDRFVVRGSRERWVARTLPAVIASAIGGVVGPAAGGAGIATAPPEALPIGASCRPARGGSRRRSSRSCSPGRASRARARGRR